MQPDSDFWAPQGRIARATTGPWEGRLLFLIPDTAPGWWIGILSPPAVPDTPGDFYADEWDLPARLEAEWGLEWYERGPEEEALEIAEFGWRPFLGNGWVHKVDAVSAQSTDASSRATTVLYLAALALAAGALLSGLPGCSWSPEFWSAMVRPATVVASIVTLSICLGLPLLLVRMIARRLRPKERLMGHLLTLGCAAGAASLPMLLVRFAASEWSPDCVLSDAPPLLGLTQLFGAVAIPTAVIVAVVVAGRR